MRYTFVTIFPNLVKFYFEESILKKAIEKEILNIEFYNPRDYTKNRHKKVDDYLCGGGAGLLMTPQPLFDCLDDILIKNKEEQPYIIFPLASGKRFTQNDAKRLAKKKNIIFVNGRYEGIDERVIERYANEVFSVGDYILTGGELPSLILSDSISRNIDGVLGNVESLEYESFENDLLEAPSFTKPKEFRNLSVVKEFLKGNHSKILNIKYQMSICKTKYYRPDIRKLDEK